MVVVSYSGREINAKIVYYGPGLSGKTTNLEKIYDSVPETNRGRMVSMKTQTDRTLFFDLLPLDLGDLQGMKTRLLLYTVPGQVYYNATRKLVLKGVDAVVFVADSAADKMAENRESLANLEMNLKAYGIDIKNLPWVLQLNKRDLPNAVPVADMVRELNRHNVPVYEAQAANGVGVFETLRGVSKLLLAKITRDVLEKDRGGVARSAGSKTATATGAPADAPAAEKAEAKGPGGKILKFLKRGKEEFAPASEPEPVREAEPEPAPAPAPPPAMMYERNPFEEPAPAPPPETAEEAPLLSEDDLLEEAPTPAAEPAADVRRPQNAEEELTLDEQDFVRQESMGADERPVARGGGGSRAGAQAPAPRPAPRAATVEPARGDSDVRRITVPIDLGELPSSGRVTLTFEVRIQVEPSGSKRLERRHGRRSDSGIDESFTQDVEVLR
jgi:signal recognition particle receptor subunit beta